MKIIRGKEEIFWGEKSMEHGRSQFNRWFFLILALGFNWSVPAKPGDQIIILF